MLTWGNKIWGIDYDMIRLNYLIHVLLFGNCMLFLIACGSHSDNNSHSALPVKPNIILIMADDLGYGDLACYGHIRHKTPYLDFMASHGIRFTDFHSNGVVCSPTRASIMTGNYPQKTGIAGVVTAKNHRDVGLPLNEITIAEYLQELGYVSGITGKWHLGYDTTYSPLNQGFDVFNGFVSGNIDYHSHYDQENFFDWWNGKQKKREKGYATDLITQHAISFIKDHKDRPFFLYVAHGAPHYPIQGRKSPSFRGENWDRKKVYGSEEADAAIYQEMIEVMDEGIGKIIQTVEELELSTNTILFFLSDNGGAPNRASNLPYKGHKGQVWEGGHRVPAICYWEGNINPSDNGSLLLSMDIFPTIVDLTGGQYEGHAELNGKSFYNLLKGEEVKMFDQRFVFWKAGNKIAARKGPMKLVRIEGQYFLYNVSEDPQESHDLKDTLPQEFEELKSAMEKWEMDMNQYPIIS